MQQNLETLFDHYPFLIHIILTFCQNKEIKIALEALELVKRAIMALVDRILIIKNETAAKKQQVFLFEKEGKNPEGEGNVSSLCENLQSTLNSKIIYFIKNLWEFLNTFWIFYSVVKSIKDNFQNY